MSKKRLILVFVMVILLLPLIYSQDIPQEVLEALPGYFNEDSGSQEEIPREVLEALSETYTEEEIKAVINNAEGVELPDAVKAMLKQQSDYYLGLQVQEQQIKKEKRLYELSKIVEAAAALLILIMIFLLVFNKHTIGFFRRNSRRIYLYHLIKSYKKNGKTFKDIEPILMKKGFNNIHVQDALIRYKENHDKKRGV